MDFQGRQKNPKKDTIPFLSPPTQIHQDNWVAFTGETSLGLDVLWLRLVFIFAVVFVFVPVCQVPLVLFQRDRKAPQERCRTSRCVLWLCSVLPCVSMFVVCHVGPLAGPRHPTGLGRWRDVVESFLLVSCWCCKKTIGLCPGVIASLLLYL